MLPNENLNDTWMWNSTQVQSAIPHINDDVDDALDSCRMYVSNGNSSTVKCNSWVYDDTYYKSSLAKEVVFGVFDLKYYMK